MAKRRGRRRKTAAKKGRSRASRRRFGWLKWLITLIVLGVLVVGGYGVFLSKQVRVQFEGKRWAIPARVYARPLELYVGAKVSAEQLVFELLALGYRKADRPSNTAEWARGKGRFLIRTRAFQFWDEQVPERSLEIHIRDGRVTGVRDFAADRELDLLRLEPALIGSIYPAHKEDRVLLRREELPEHLVQALLAVEDRKFYAHHGIDLRAVLRALLANIRAGRAVQGGSTLTQQLVKNFFLTPERSLRRKFDEAMMALILESRYTKDEILEAYVNEIFLGQDGDRAIHGFGLGSIFYFNRPLQELNLSETALLVGLIKGASFYNPRRHPERALERRNLVLEQMAQQQFIRPAQAEAAQQSALGIAAKGRSRGDSYPAFVDLVRRQLRRDYREQDLTSEGLRIFASLDPWAQHAAQQVLDDQLAQLAQAKPERAAELQGALVLAGNQGGEVLALVGGRGSDVQGFNRALDARRPIGSLVKPAVYLTALTQSDRFHLMSLLEDTELTLRSRGGQVWQPRNYDELEHGHVFLHEALAHSYNLATVRLGMELGLRSVIGTLEALGIEREVAPLPALLLGAISLTPFEVAQMYQTIASGGFRTPLRAIREVLTIDGEPLQRYPVDVRQTVDPAAVYLLTRNLAQVVRAGTGRGLARYLDGDIDVAGKTGTTNELRDSWFAGFSNDLVGVVWLGRDDNRPMGLTGSRGALPVWGRLMRRLEASSLERVAPETIEYLWVNPRTGLLADEQCEGAAAFPFIRGSAPTVRDECVSATEARRSGGFLQRWLP